MRDCALVTRWWLRVTKGTRNGFLCGGKRGKPSVGWFTRPMAAVLACVAAFVALLSVASARGTHGDPALDRYPVASHYPELQASPIASFTCAYFCPVGTTFSNATFDGGVTNLCTNRPANNNGKYGNLVNCTFQFQSAYPGTVFRCVDSRVAPACHGNAQHRRRERGVR